MSILVPIKQILDPSGLTVNRKAGKVFVNREAYKIDPASKCALEAALRIKETWLGNGSGPVEVIAVAFGTAQADDALREALAMGVDRAVLIPTGPLDSVGVVNVLAALTSHLGSVDLILNGHRTLDTGQSSGARLAEALNWPYLGEAVDCLVQANVVRIVRSDPPPARSYQAYEANLPAVVTVTSAGPKPRYAPGGSIIVSYRDAEAYETISTEDLGLHESDLQAVTAERGQSFPPEREFGRAVTVEEIAGRLK